MSRSAPPDPVVAADQRELDELAFLVYLRACSRRNCVEHWPEARIVAIRNGLRIVSCGTPVAWRFVSAHTTTGAARGQRTRMLRQLDRLADAEGGLTVRVSIARPEQLEMLDGTTDARFQAAERAMLASTERAEELQRASAAGEMVAERVTRGRRR